MNLTQSKTDEQIKKMFANHFKEKANSIKKLPQSGSERAYYRVTSNNHTAIATLNSNIKENEAFLYLSSHFAEKNLPVPKIYQVNTEQTAYLQEDLGNDTLYIYLQKNKHKKDFPEKRKELYKQILNNLIDIQIKGAEKLNFEKCYPRKAFDEQSIRWDLNYFKYMFAKTANIDFDEQSLENEFVTFVKLILQTPADYFMYRDFQSRNIMYNQSEIKFIDYQGGRKGSLQYDLASLLYEAKTQLPDNLRQELLQYYAELVSRQTKISQATFINDYPKFVLLRLMQAMGAYGYRGIIQRKNVFIQSIAPAQNNLKKIIPNATFLEEMPEFKKLLINIVESEDLRKLSLSAGLKIEISSFSYKRGIPYDNTGNGGGFVFDCRFLDNPGRIEKYKKLTGRDQAVIDYLQNNTQADDFANDCYTMVYNASQSYINRNYTSLKVAFGCTGGQHRSVYVADKVAEMLRQNPDINIEVKHLEQNF